MFFMLFLFILLRGQEMLNERSVKMSEFADSSLGWVRYAEKNFFRISYEVPLQFS